MKIGCKEFDFFEKTYIMGILNVTPDSFSDGGKYLTVDKSVEHVKKMLYDGADIIDIGGESTRPGHIPISADEEISRIVPIIKGIKANIKDVVISVDTSKSQVAKEAILAGADLINDVWGLKKDKDMAKIIAEHDIPCCLMHNKEVSSYSNLMEDIRTELAESIRIAIKSGISEDMIIVDPGIGFGKTYEENLIIMNNLDEIKSLGFPLLLGASRKSVIGNTLNLPVEERVEGTIATTVIGIIKGCNIIRVHDVKENVRAAIMTDAILEAKEHI